MKLPALLKKLSADRHTGTINTFTVADWTTSGIIFSSIQRNADKNLLLQSHFEPWPPDFDPFASAQETAAFLRSLQQQHSWIVRPAAMSVPRQLTTMRLLQVPAAASADLAGAISLQLETRQQSAEPQQWDFLQHPDIVADTLYVTVLQVPARIANIIAEIAALAGWKKPVLTPADLFVGGASMAPGEFRISLQMNRSKLEVVVFRGGLPAASMATGAQFARDPDNMGSIVLSLMQRVVETLPESWRSGSGEIPLAVSGSHAAPLARLLQSHGVTVLPGPFDERSPRAFAHAGISHWPTPGFCTGRFTVHSAASLQSAAVPIRTSSLCRSPQIRHSHGSRRSLPAAHFRMVALEPYHRSAPTTGRTTGTPASTAGADQSRPASPAAV